MPQVSKGGLLLNFYSFSLETNKQTQTRASPIVPTIRKLGFNSLLLKPQR